MGGGGGDKASPAPMQPMMAPQPVAPTTDSSTTQDAVTSDQKRRASAAGLASTDLTQGTLAGNPANLNKSAPTLLGQ